MTGTLISALLLTVTATNSSTVSVTPADSLTRSHTLTAALLVGSSVEAELSWYATSRFQFASSVGFLDDAKGQWRVATDAYYHFPNFIGSVSEDADMGFYVGLGAQVAGRRPGDDETSVRFGERVSFGLRYTLDSGRYEAIAVVAPGLVHRPRQRATLDALVGLRLGF